MCLSRWPAHPAQSAWLPAHLRQLLLDLLDPDAQAPALQHDLLLAAAAAAAQAAGA